MEVINVAKSSPSKHTKSKYSIIRLTTKKIHPKGFEGNFQITAKIFNNRTTEQGEITVTQDKLNNLNSRKHHKINTRKHNIYKS